MTPLPSKNANSSIASIALSAKREAQIITASTPPMFLVKIPFNHFRIYRITYPSLCVAGFFSFPVVHKQERPWRSFQQKAPAGRRLISTILLTGI